MQPTRKLHRSREKSVLFFNNEPSYRFFPVVVYPPRLITPSPANLTSWSRSIAQIPREIAVSTARETPITLGRKKGALRRYVKEKWQAGRVKFTRRSTRCWSITITKKLMELFSQAGVGDVLITPRNTHAFSTPDIIINRIIMVDRRGRGYPDDFHGAIIRRILFLRIRKPGISYSSINSL